MWCNGDCERCPHFDPAPIVPGNYSGYCDLYNDAVDNVLMEMDKGYSWPQQYPMDESMGW